MKLVMKPRFCGFTMLVEAGNGFVASFTTEAGPKKTCLRGQLKLKLELLLKLPRHALTKSCNPVKTLDEPVISDVTYLLLSRNILVEATRGQSLPATAITAMILHSFFQVVTSGK